MKKTIVLAIVAAAMWGGANAAPQCKVAPRAAIKVAASDGHAILSAYVTIDPQTFDREAFEATGAQVVKEYGRVLTARFPADILAHVANVEGVKYVEASAPAAQMLDIAKQETGMNAVHSGTGFDSPYTGKGVVIGIVDNGFDYGHAAFADADGNLRIKRVWEQAGQPTGTLQSPAVYGYGIEMLTSDEILSAGGDIRSNSHGTHVASIAAGSDSYYDGIYRGMAPDADIVLVSMTEGGTNNVNITNAISYIFDYADEAGLPCVVNLSLGAHSGPHDGTSTFDALADAMQGPGRLIVGSAGNHRADKFHVRKAFAGADNAALRTYVDYKTSPSASNLGGDVEIWASKGMELQVALCAYKIETGEAAERVVVYPAESEDAQEVSLGRNITGTVAVATEISPLNGKPHILITSAVTGIRNGYGFGIEVTPLSAGTVDIWADNTKLGLTSKNAEGFVGPSDESTICEIGGTAQRILTVGSYTTRSTYRLLGETSDRTLPGETDGQVSVFSSAGPTADGRTKPQVSAPGCFIIGAVSSYDNSGTILRAAYRSEDGNEYSYGYMQGTSMSSPLVAGVVATWLQAYPQLTPEQLAEVVAETSRKDEFTGALTVPTNDWGYGKINPAAGLSKCIQLAGSGIESAISQPTDDKRIYNLQGILVSADGNLQSLPKGIYLMGGKKVCKW